MIRWMISASVFPVNKGRIARISQRTTPSAKMSVRAVTGSAARLLGRHIRRLALNHPGSGPCRSDPWRAQCKSSSRTRPSRATITLCGVTSRCTISRNARARRSSPWMCQRPHTIGEGDRQTQLPSARFRALRARTDEMAKVTALDEGHRLNQETVRFQNLVELDDVLVAGRWMSSASSATSPERQGRRK